MIFNSFVFVAFYLVVLALYWNLPRRWRWSMLLVASCGFYMAFVPVYILILFFTIGVDFWAGQLIERSQGRTRERWLTASIVANLGVLAFFKYYAFLNENLSALLGGVGIGFRAPELGILLPIGLSFHTFQSLAYTIEVYRGNQRAERHLGYFALYVMYFPQLVAGPIERAEHLLPQLRNPPAHWDHARFRAGIAQALFGLFKKVCVADTLALHVNAVYNSHSLQGGADLLLATALFAFQIYCDFSGYSDIAVGVARMMGVDLMENFRLPYFSKSVTEFWQRWHISLSTWLRDYLYIPLGGNRHGRWMTYRNLMLTMLLGGLWHGASWNFVIWGGANGAFLSAERALGVKAGAPVPWYLRPFRVLFCFLLICFTWVFFRAQSFAQAMDILHGIGTWRGEPYIRDLGVFLNLSVMLAALLAFEFLFLRGRTMQDLARRWGDARTALFCALVLVVIGLFGVSDGSQFIYFQF